LLTIRLARTGKKKQPCYRIVVLEKLKRRDGRYIDMIGHYNPKTNPSSIQMDREKYAFWVEKGAQPSKTVKSFLDKIGSSTATPVPVE